MQRTDIKLYDKIHTMAESTYEGPVVTGENCREVWFPHWFACAEKVYQEFVDEGLVETAKRMRELINDCKELEVELA